MQRIKYAFVVSVALVLSACQSVNIYEVEKRSLTEPANSGQGFVRITDFQVPKDNPGTAISQILDFIGRDANSSGRTPISISIFDVTQETIYLGTFRFPAIWPWIETAVPPGKRRLMLTLASRSDISISNSHTDFIELDVAANSVKQIGLSRYGITQFPYFVELAIADEHRKECSALSDYSGSRRKRIDLVEKYMNEHQINEYANYFKQFCLRLSDPKFVQKPTTEALNRFAEQRGTIEQLKNEGIKHWRQQSEPRAPFDLTKSFEPKGNQIPYGPGSDSN